jgi:hypothetical protein
MVAARMVTGSEGSASQATRPVPCSTAIAVATSTWTAMGHPTYATTRRHESVRLTITASPPPHAGARPARLPRAVTRTEPQFDRLCSVRHRSPRPVRYRSVSEAEEPSPGSENRSGAV